MPLPCRDPDTTCATNRYLPRKIPLDKLGGRTIARAYGRDTGAKAGDGVIVDAGKIDSAGSAKNWKTVAREGTVIRVLDVPRATAEALCAADHQAYRVEIVGDAGPVAVDRESLAAERNRLLARVVEIDAILGPAAAS